MIIKKEIIDKIEEQNPENISMSILVGLRIIVERSGET